MEMLKSWVWDPFRACITYQENNNKENDFLYSSPFSLFLFLNSNITSKSHNQASSLRHSLTPVPPNLFSPFLFWFHFISSFYNYM
jgi:hypothetical protein